jgi:hypothetical protein
MKTIQLSEGEELLLVAKDKFPKENRIFLLRLGNQSLDVREFDILSREPDHKRKEKSSTPKTEGKSL